MVLEKGRAKAADNAEEWRLTAMSWKQRVARCEALMIYNMKAWRYFGRKQNNLNFHYYLIGTTYKVLYTR
jgi:hypothetical protein